jgi:hypothetical protein
LLPPPVPPSPGLGRLGSTTGGRTDTSRPSRTPPREEQPARTAALMTNVATTARCKLRCTEAFLAEFLAFMSNSDLKCKHALKGLLIDMKQVACHVFLFSFGFIFVFINQRLILFSYSFSGCCSQNQRAI